MSKEKGEQGMGLLLAKHIQLITHHSFLITEW
jgi:hypothetical protein